MYMIFLMCFDRSYRCKMSNVCLTQILSVQLR